MYQFDRAIYRQAFLAYIRTGASIERAVKQNITSDQYVWRTEQDERVGPAHRANDGHLFRWDEPPPTGNPGEDFNCRCTAEPYIEGETEFATHELLGLDQQSEYRWGDADFVAHYYLGGGQAVTLGEIGHLAEIAEQYSYFDKGIGGLRRWSNQIARAARAVRNGALELEFENAFDFGDVEFSHGFGVVAGIFEGTSDLSGRMLRINGLSRFEFTDRFEDPVGLGIEVGGTPYAISGQWQATFVAEVFLDPAESDYS